MGNRRKRFFITWLAAGCAVAFLAASSPGKEEVNPYQSLIDNSPFLTPAFKNRIGQRDNVSLGFVGYTRVGDEWMFAIVERKGGKTHWLKLNVEEDGIKVDRFDETARKIHLMLGDIGIDLALEWEK